VLQVSVVQTLLSLQFLAAPVQTPLEHASFTVQTLLSLQTVPFGFPSHEPHPGTGVCTQLPETVLQESVVHRLLSSQFLAVPVQAVFTHLSPEVQALLSLQERVLAQ